MDLTIKDVIRSIEDWAPTGMAEAWDRVGLHVGDPARSVDSVLIGLDMTHQLLEEAAGLGAQLIVTHHPLLLKPVSTITPASLTGGLAFRLAEAGIALYCAHTNLDSVRGGVSHALADRLGLRSVEFLGGLEERNLKLVVFVPQSHADAVREAVAEAGAGRIGRYEACSFTTTGTGRFRGLEGSNPVVGEAGGAGQEVSECRIEVEAARWTVPAVVEAMKSAHPYEEVAYDLYSMEQPFRDAGIGVVGDLAKPETLESFLGTVSDVLDNPALRYVGNLESEVARVAVCGGAGTPYISEALRSGADAYVTADVSHHRFFEVLDTSGTPSMALIDAGHYETERCTEDLLRDFLSKAFPALAVHVTQTRTGAAKTFVRRRPEKA